MRVMSHIRCASETRKPSGRYRRGIGITVHLKCRPNKGVHGVLTGKLTKNAVGPQTAIPSGEENIGASTNVFIHSDLASERMNALNPSALDSWNECGEWIQRKMLADLSTEPERLSIGWKKKFDGGRVETDSVIERLNL